MSERHQAEHHTQPVKHESSQVLNAGVDGLQEVEFRHFHILKYPGRKVLISQKPTRTNAHLPQTEKSIQKKGGTPQSARPWIVLP